TIDRAFAFVEDHNRRGRASLGLPFRVHAKTYCSRRCGSPIAISPPPFLESASSSRNSLAYRVQEHCAEKTTDMAVRLCFGAAARQFCPACHGDCHGFAAHLTKKMGMAVV